jgi:hypothetical protein
MTTPHRATPEQWADQEAWAVDDDDSSCILELRARIEELEAAHLEAPMTKPRAASAEARPAGLVERVLNAMDEHVRVTRYAEARATIRGVIAAAKEADITHADTLIHWLEQEADRG